MAAVAQKKKGRAKAPKRVFSVLRRHRINEDDVRRVLSHLKVNDKITANDIGLPKWAHRLKKPTVRKVAHGRLALFEGELQIVPVERVDEVLRELEEHRRAAPAQAAPAPSAGDD